MSNYIASVDWLSLLSTNLTAGNLWSAFSNVLQSAIDLFVPVNYVRRDNSVKCRRWYPAALKRAIARKRCLWRKHRESPDDERLLAAYHSAERKCRQMLRDYEIKRDNRVIDSDNAGSFFRFVNGKLSCKRGLGAINDEKGGVITGDAERANLLNDYFTSMCVDDDGETPAFDQVVSENLENIQFTPEQVHAAIKQLKLGGAIAAQTVFRPECLKPIIAVFTSFMSVGQ